MTVVHSETPIRNARRRPAAHPSAVDLMTASLPQLLAEYAVELDDSPITDPTFFGALVERRDGSRVLSMPIGRSAFERDTAARMLLAEGLGLDTRRRRRR